jgi:ABC-2 type transport system ATP-binding protein
VIKAKNLTKKFRSRNFRDVKTAVDDLSFEVETGKVTGFLGPNGAGKSTTMRLMLGLDNGSGQTTYDGKKLHAYPEPSKVVGILLEAKAFHPTRSARNHLKILAEAGDIPLKRVDEVLDIVGLKDVAKKAPGKFSLGMAQRLGIAAAILGQPKYLILDEPANGLDPEGIAWLRQFLKDYAKNDHAVFVSSHLLSEMALMADNVVVIGKGKLIADTSIKEMVAGRGTSVFVRVDKVSALETALKSADLEYKKEDKGLLVSAVQTDAVGKLAHSADLTVLELAAKTASLEQAFLELTEGSEEYQAKTAGAKK